MAETLQVTLPDALMQEIADKVDSGEVASADELVSEALTAHFAADRERHLDGIRERLRVALADNRPSVPIDEAFARIRADLTRRHDET